MFENEPGPPVPPPRTFVDSEGLSWEVREIRSHILPERLARLLGTDERRRAGWLVFQSAQGEKRRASPFPADWAKLSTYELERWCMRSVRVPPAPARRREDS
jgi:hypothetical protein